MAGLLASRVKIRPHITTSLGKRPHSEFQVWLLLNVSDYWTITESKKRNCFVTCPLFVIPREAVNVAAMVVVAVGTVGAGIQIGY